jgi:CheY-like chemotaxis protein
VTSASSAAEALAAIELGAPDVMVSDVGMPDEDGYELVRRLRLLPAAKGGRLPVVALTAYARAEERTRALRAGFNMHVPKPVEPSELLAVIASLAARSMTA